MTPRSGGIRSGPPTNSMARIVSTVRHPSRPQWAPILLLLPAVLLTAGCPTWSQNPFHPAEPNVTVDDLARALELTVKDSSPTQAELRGGANSVMIFAGFNPRVFVNGKALDSVGPIVPGQTGQPLQLSVQWADAIANRLTPFDPPGREGPVAYPPRRRPPGGGAVIGNVMVDPGHGGRQPGAISVYRQEEKVITLAVGTAVASHLQAGNVRATLTRTTDQTILPQDRAILANRAMPDLFLCIHADAKGGPGASLARGYTILVPQRISPESRAVAAAINARLAPLCPRGRGVHTDSRGIRVLKDTHCPSVLVELGFLTNPYEASLLSDPGYQDKLARAIAQGVVDYFDAKGGRGR